MRDKREAEHLGRHCQGAAVRRQHGKFPLRCSNTEQAAEWGAVHTGGQRYVHTGGQRHVHTGGQRHVHTGGQRYAHSHMLASLTPLLHLTITHEHLKHGKRRTGESHELSGL